MPCETVSSVKLRNIVKILQKKEINTVAFGYGHSRECFPLHI